MLRCPTVFLLRHNWIRAWIVNGIQNPLKTNKCCLKSSSSNWPLYQCSTLSTTFNFLEQVQDIWRVKHDNMADLCKKVKELKGMFLQFQINHVLRVGITSFHYLLILFRFTLHQPALGFVVWMLHTILHTSALLGTKAYSGAYMRSSNSKTLVWAIHD
jgi:hypothetical protein